LTAEALVVLSQTSKEQLMTKVLVIEDEEILRESILNILETNGFSTIEAGDGRSGVRLAREFVPNVILCDVRMPGFDGYEVLKALRQDPVTANIPLLFLTAENMQNVMRQGEQLGANGYLSKPFTTVQLLKVIAQGLRDCHGHKRC
jgi:CheY-like chemotaxis protein